jgi:alpha-glucosidase
MHRYLNVLAFFLTISLLAPIQSKAQTSYSVFSPDRRIEVRIRTADRIRYDVLFKGVPLLEDSTLALDVNHVVLGVGAQVTTAKESSYDHTVEPVIRQKFAKIRENYNELRLEMAGDYVLVFRAYNEGATYRWETALPSSEVKVYGETANFRFAKDYSVFYPQEDSFFSHNERHYLPMAMSSISSTSIATLPAVVSAEGETKVAIAESDVNDYPGLWLRGTGTNSLSAVFPPYPLKEKLERDRDFRVTESAEYIAVTQGRRTYPWRILGIAEDDGRLITNQLVWLLAKPSQVEDTSWIKPGKVAWDWWNANNIYGVDFKSGITTQTYKYYIDFAAKYGLQYIILDEGWYRLGNLLDVIPEVNVQELVSYGREKGVGIILWVVWKTLDDQLIAALDQFQKWGVKGIKVDFMQRDDQLMIAFLHKVSRETAKRKMLVDFHGVQRSATMTRTWPNLISNEGVLGNEWSKWSTAADPKHNVTLPFTRMFLGPMDYTPGAMRNATRRDFVPIFDSPMSLSTRCQQLAMYVVFESPLQMLADNPSNYLREPEAMEFLAAVPSTWDETRVLGGRISEYVIVARRKNSDWYIGAMTDSTPREIDVDLSFLPEGRFIMDAYQDGVNADRHAEDYKKTTSEVSRLSKFKIRLSEGGGWAARIRLH